MKLVFLAQQETPQDVEALTGSPAPYNFGRHLYGPFSQGLLRDVDILVGRGLIRQESKPLDSGGTAVRWEYEITPGGNERIAMLAGAGQYRQLQALVVRFAQFSTEELLRYVYTRYVRDSTRLLDRAIPA